MGRFIRHHSTARRWLVSCIAAGAVALLAMLDVRAQGDNQFQLFIAAVDASGAPVTDLKPEEISFAESGMPGKIVTLERFNRPVKLTLLVDNGPDSERLLEFYRTGLTGLADALPADVEVALYTTAPQPREKVKFTVDRGVLKKAFASLGRDSDDARFTDSFVEYVVRLDKDIKDKKLTYSPALIMLSAIGGDPATRPLSEVEKSIVTIANAGGRASVIVTTSKLNDATAKQDLTIGRQGTIGAKLAKSTRGNFQALPDPKVMVTLLPEWGKQIAETHAKQTTQFRVVLQRPAGVSGPINPQNLDLRVTRPGVKPSVSGDGRF